MPVPLLKNLDVIPQLFLVYFVSVFVVDIGHVKHQPRSEETESQRKDISLDPLDLIQGEGVSFLNGLEDLGREIERLASEELVELVLGELHITPQLVAELELIVLGDHDESRGDFSVESVLGLQKGAGPDDVVEKRGEFFERKELVFLLAVDEVPGEIVGDIVEELANDEFVVAGV